jgi:hypothetical protein
MLRLMAENATNWNWWYRSGSRLNDKVGCTDSLALVTSSTTQKAQINVDID